MLPLLVAVVLSFLSLPLKKTSVERSKRLQIKFEKN